MTSTERQPVGPRSVTEPGLSSSERTRIPDTCDLWDKGGDDLRDMAGCDGDDTRDLPIVRGRRKSAL